MKTQVFLVGNFRIGNETELYLNFHEILQMNADSQHKVILSTQPKIIGMKQGSVLCQLLLLLYVTDIVEIFGTGKIFQLLTTCLYLVFISPLVLVTWL
ncbi:unnamed protein product, partial [Dicrocoelium dendriticum]